MEKGTRFGKLTVDYLTDANNIFCVCDCGTRIIVAEGQLNENSSCGCVHRILLWANQGMADQGRALINDNTAPQHESRGINFDKKKNKWRARITFQSKEYHLGYYPDKETASEIKREAESNLDNFIEWFNNFKNNSMS
jgi:hypothetical protein